MSNQISALTYKVVAYQSVPDYDLDESVDWAVEMVELGFNSESLLVLAGLSKPVNYFKTVGYLNAAIQELDLVLKTGDEGIISYSSYYIRQIAQDIGIRKNLSIITDYVIDVDYHSSIYDFSNLKWAWDDMEWNDGQQWYWPGATLDNIEQIAMETAQQWLIQSKYSYSQHIRGQPAQAAVEHQVINEETSLIDEIKVTLHHYPELTVEHSKPDVLVIGTNQSGGFDIGLVTTPEEYTLYLDDYHMHYQIGDEDKILQLIADAFAGRLRIEVYAKNGHDYK